MTEKSAQHWAIDLTHILKATYGNDYFPVNVDQLAKEYSKIICPDEPIHDVISDSFSDIEGCLIPSADIKGWVIVHNSQTQSEGRKRFTVAHEFGHYLMHRQKYPEGIRCTEKDMTNWNSEYSQKEKEANEFSSALLIPRDDFERQVNINSHLSHNLLMDCGSRYGVSFTAITLRWLQLTTKRAMLIVSRDGFVLWARSSDSAYNSGRYIKTKNVKPLEWSPPQDGTKKEYNNNSPFSEPFCEEAFHTPKYDLTYSLLSFDDYTPPPQQNLQL